MIDITDEKQVLEISVELRRASVQYHKAIREAAEARYNLNIIMAQRMSDLREKKSNLGYETARVMMLEYDEPEITQYYEQEEKATAKAKGLAKICDALHSQISLVQSLIKNRTQEGA